MKITLIPETAQEAFNSVWNQLKTQRRRAMEGSTCAYRVGGNPEGARCAIGGMIRDEEYNSEIEGSGINQLMVHNKVYSYVEPGFLSALQRVHDNPGNWKLNYDGLEDGLNEDGWNALSVLAVQYNLDVSG